MRVILADHDKDALWALRTALEEEPGLEVVGAATDARQLLAAAERGKADLILVDRRLPGNGMKVLIAKLHALARTPIVVVLFTEQEDGRLLLREGADAVVSKGDQPAWLLETVRHFASRQNTGAEQSN